MPRDQPASWWMEYGLWHQRLSCLSHVLLWLLDVHSWRVLKLPCPRGHYSHFTRGVYQEGGRNTERPDASTPCSKLGVTCLRVEASYTSTYLLLLLPTSDMYHLGLFILFISLFSGGFCAFLVWLTCGCSSFIIVKRIFPCRSKSCNFPSSFHFHSYHVGHAHFRHPCTEECTPQIEMTVSLFISQAEG